MSEKPYKMVLYIYNLPAERRDEYMQHVADLTEDFGATCTGVIKLDDEADEATDEQKKGT